MEHYDIYSTYIYITFNVVGSQLKNKQKARVFLYTSNAILMQLECPNKVPKSNEIFIIESK